MARMIICRAIGPGFKSSSDLSLIMLKVEEINTDNKCLVSVHLYVLGDVLGDIRLKLAFSL